LNPRPAVLDSIVAVLRGQVGLRRCGSILAGLHHENLVTSLGPAPDRRPEA
jgi:hypothetical protein